MSTPSSHFGALGLGKNVPEVLDSVRERREDIPKLIRHFVEKCAARLHKRIEVIPEEAVHAMMNWRWPGNIRELENFIERSVILSEGNRLTPPLAELREEISPQLSGSDLTLREREREHIIEILRYRVRRAQPRGLASSAPPCSTRCSGWESRARTICTRQWPCDLCVPPMWKIRSGRDI